MTQANGIKISVTLPSDIVADIETLSVRLGVTPGELLQRAIKLEKYLDDVEDQDGIVLVKTADNKMRRITRG
jgi:predicted DNA-binding protein